MPLISCTVRCATLVAGGVALLALGAPPAGAATPSAQVNISPVGTAAPYFTVSVPAGASHRLTVALSNPGRTGAEADTYAANVYTIVNGGFGAGLQGQPGSGVTTWLAYPARTVRLGPGRSEQLSFTVSVPKGTAPGEHVTSLVVQEQAQAKSAGAVALDQVTREALPIVIDVPGRLGPAMTIGTAVPSSFAGRTTIAVSMTNTGNLRLHPDARLVVTNANGRAVGTVAVKMGTVYPGDSTTVEGTLNTALAPGHYTVAADLSDSTLGVAAQHEGLSIAVSAAPHYVAAPAPSASTRQPSQITRGLPITLAVGLVLAALLAGVAATTGGAYLRRRRAATNGAPLGNRRGTK